MKPLLPLLLCLLLAVSASAEVTQTEAPADKTGNCRQAGRRAECDAGPAWCAHEQSTCTPEMRGRCGKRRGDWYGARQPVATSAEARGLLENYFAGQQYTVSEVSEKKWGFSAEISDKNGTVIDRVMIDKRSGRIRSLN